MKKILLLVALFATASIKPGFAQDNMKTSSLAPLLASYYDIKNALVKSSSQDAAASAGDFLKAVKGVDVKSLDKADMDTFVSFQDKLAFDARHMSESKDIAHQREHFATLSSNFFKFAKAVKLPGKAIYYDYCPMKKSYWLSADATIKNPYFGSQMLTCGKVSQTLNK